MLTKAINDNKNSLKVFSGWTCAVRFPWAVVFHIVACESDTVSTIVVVWIWGVEELVYQWLEWGHACLQSIHHRESEVRAHVTIFRCLTAKILSTGVFAALIFTLWVFFSVHVATEAVFSCPFTTLCPWKMFGEWSKKVIQGPRYYHIVEKVCVECYQYNSPTDSWKSKDIFCGKWELSHI